MLVGELALGFVMRFETSIGNCVSSTETCNIVAKMQRVDEFMEGRRLSKAQGQSLLVDQVTYEVIERNIFHVVASLDVLAQEAFRFFGRAAEV